MGIGEESSTSSSGGITHPLRMEDVLQSITWGANKSGLATLAIKSAHFGTYLRMDGWGPYLTSKGGGIINCQSFIGISELFRLVPQEDGTVGIQSVHCGNFIRMDGENVMDTSNGSGTGGTVNCQSFVGEMEKFTIQALEGGCVAIKSPLFHTYLRMDAINAVTQPINLGGGNVNCSREIRSWERFYIEVIKPVVALKSLACKLYLRVDCCSSNTEGRVSGQNYLGAWEKFILVRGEDGTVQIKSEAFKTFFIHVLDDETKSVTVSDKLSSKFLLQFQEDGTVVFGSVDNKGWYLSMATDGTVTCMPEDLNHKSHCFIIVVDT
eukprot:Phypoly_transcript_10663.p1 GENE.Phypoly_transcript_10663~~Phypoly_transcript_10663.p1  ORF type:complete len:323 (+),score=27.75 Phypoly_transcript_10663:116-1084(+)